MSSMQYILCRDCPVQNTYCFGNINGTTIMKYIISDAQNIPLIEYPVDNPNCVENMSYTVYIVFFKMVGD